MHSHLNHCNRQNLAIFRRRGEEATIAVGNSVRFVGVTQQGHGGILAFGVAVGSDGKGALLTGSETGVERRILASWVLNAGHAAVIG